MKLLAIIEAAVERRFPNSKHPAGAFGAISQWTSVEPIFVIRGSEAQFCAVASQILTHRSDSITIRAADCVLGSACMALLAADHLDEDELCVVEGEQQLRWDLEREHSSLRCGAADVGAVVFDSPDPCWSRVRLTSGGEILEASDAASIDRAAVAGVYYFRRGVEFRQAVEQMILKRKPAGRGFALAPALNESILAGKRVLGVPLSPTQAQPTPRDDSATAYRDMVLTIDRSQAAASGDKRFARAA